MIEQTTMTAAWANLALQGSLRGGSFLSHRVATELVILDGRLFRPNDVSGTVA